MLCAVCSKESQHFCSKCRKISYCSKECQKGHWKIHRADCFPLKVELSEKFGRYLVATKNIKQWEVILKEKPIVCGPSDIDNIPLCLGCFVILENPSYMCSHCKWPMCNPLCEKVITHANFECKVFVKASTMFSLMPRTYSYIHVLRGLLLKEANPNKWRDLQCLVSHVDKKMSTLQGIFDFAACTEFIRETCGLTQFAESEIHHVLGAIGVNAFGGEDYQPDKPRSGSHLYNIASMAAHSCVPNCYRFIDEKNMIEFRACVDIPEGVQVSTFYVNTWRPTQDRQEHLKSTYYFSCSCDRCIDPTELGTYFSATSCGEINESDCSGYLLPVDPADEDTQWQCDKCKVTTNDQMARTFNFEFQQLVDDVPEALSLRNLQRLEDITKLYQSKAHPNHSIMVDLEYDIAERMHNMLAANVFSGEKQNTILNRQITICNHQLEMADVLRPGYNIFRGKVLHFLQYAKCIQLLETRPNRLQAALQIKEIEDIRTIALKILSIEPAEGIKAIAESLKNDMEIRMLKTALRINN